MKSESRWLSNGRSVILRAHHHAHAAHVHRHHHEAVTMKTHQNKALLPFDGIIISHGPGVVNGKTHFHAGFMKIPGVSPELLVQFHTGFHRSGSVIRYSVMAPDEEINMTEQEYGRTAVVFRWLKW